VRFAWGMAAPSVHPPGNASAATFFSFFPEISSNSYDEPRPFHVSANTITQAVLAARAVIDKCIRQDGETLQQAVASLHHQARMHNLKGCQARVFQMVGGFLKLV
jgi:hypothetical protein